MKFNWALSTDVGNYRKANQDYIDFSENKTGQSFGIVCDGMGGHAHGEIASKMAVKTLSKLFSKTDFRNMDNSQINRWLRSSIGEVLNDMVDFAKDNPYSADMGTTLTAILFANNFAYVVNVGDSRTYKVLDDSLFQISQDQNLWNSTPETERKKIQESRSLNYTNEVTFWKVLTSALGPQKTLRIDTYFVDEAKGMYILTTDGVHDYFDPNDVLEILHNRKIKMKDKTKMIIENAKENLSTDNLSILIIEVE